MIRIVTKDNAERHLSSLHQMHRIRKAVFKDRLGWDVTVSGELEVDEYDALGPSCLVSIDRHLVGNSSASAPRTESATRSSWPDSLPCPPKSSDSLKHVWASRTQPQPDRKNSSP